MKAFLSKESKGLLLSYLKLMFCCPLPLHLIISSPFKKANCAGILWPLDANFPLFFFYYNLQRQNTLQQFQIAYFN